MNGGLWVACQLKRSVSFKSVSSSFGACRNRLEIFVCFQWMRDFALFNYCKTDVLRTVFPSSFAS